MDSNEFTDFFWEEEIKIYKTFSCGIKETNRCGIPDQRDYNKRRSKRKIKGCTCDINKYITDKFNKGVRVMVLTGEYCEEDYPFMIQPRMRNLRMLQRRQAMKLGRSAYL